VHCLRQYSRDQNRLQIPAKKSILIQFDFLKKFDFDLRFDNRNITTSFLLKADIKPLSIISPARYRWAISWITENSTDPPAVPPANLVGDAFAKRRPVGRFGGGSVTAGHGCGWVG